MRDRRGAQIVTLPFGVCPFSDDVMTLSEMRRSCACLIEDCWPPLSPNEEITLRRVALGVAEPADLPAKDVERLRAPMLVEEHGAALRLTPVGKQRYLALPNSAAFDLGAPDEGLARMAEFISKARG
jgi:hypothetical protein